MWPATAALPAALAAPSEAAGAKTALLVRIVRVADRREEAVTEVVLVGKVCIISISSGEGREAG